MDKILAADKALFAFLNKHWHTSFGDWFLPLMRNSNTWIPLYIFILIFILMNGKKDKYWWVLAAILIAVLSNFISSSIIKEHIFRLRPCNDPDFKSSIQFLIGYRPQSSSFTSSHATNHFTMAAFFFFTLHKYIGKIAWAFFAWAGIICVAQVYVGVHFPLDVTCGGIIGFILGYLCATSFNKRYLLM
jgi:membrane-associated phospholipid phosphatase